MTTAASSAVSPACRLEGLVVEGGWQVGPLLIATPNMSGGNFCQRYKVISPSGEIAFLKALDFQFAFSKGGDVTVTVQHITTLFNFERDLLELCGQRRMDRVVKAISSGVVDVDPSDPYAKVPYLIFESADADMRVHLDSPAGKPTLAWKLRALHQIATGLKQLHSAAIAHQDLKPSNVLVFLLERQVHVSKLADLGRASRFGHPSPFDGELWAGDPNYAPPEIRYSFVDPDWSKRRLAGDLYMLGGLVSFMLTETTSLATLMHELDPRFWPGAWGGTFHEVLPYLISAHATTVDQFAAAIPGEVRDDLVPLFRRLSHPDPSQRSFPNVPINRNVLERYVSRFDYLACRAAALRR